MLTPIGNLQNLYLYGLSGMGIVDFFERMLLGIGLAFLPDRHKEVLPGNVRKNIGDKPESRLSNQANEIEMEQRSDKGDRVQGWDVSVAILASQCISNVPAVNLLFLAALAGLYAVL